MRTVSGGNAAQPTSGFGPDTITAVKIEVANAADALVDLTSDVVSLEYEHGTDEIVDAATVVFRRLEGVNSLAPLMTASPPVAVGRRIVVSVNPGSGTYTEVFRGKIDDVDWPERFGDVKVQCRDQAGTAADTWIENAIEYSTTAGVSLETVMQEVADDNLTTSYTLNFPAATGAVVQHVAGDPPYGPSEQSVLDALRALAESIGWTTRWRHFMASASDWKWTVFQPSRTKTAPDHTFAASAYWEVAQMEQSIADIRNVVRVEYPATAGARLSVTVTDSVSTGGAMTAASTTLTIVGGNTFAATDVGKAIKVPGAGAAGATLSTTIATYVSGTEITLATAASTTVSGKSVEWGSIATYGRRYMKITEDSNSPINTATLATALANAALSDLKAPNALLEVECRYFWPGEVGVDLYRFSANDKHFSSNQDLAPIAFRHRIAVGERPTTWITCRGKPSGGVLMWRRRIGSSLPTTVASDISVTNFREIERTETAVTLGWDSAGDIDEFWLWTSTPAQPLASDPWVAMIDRPSVRLTAATEEYDLTIPDYGLITYVQIIPIGVRTNVVVRGEARRFTIQGGEVAAPQGTVSIGSDGVVKFSVDGPISAVSYKWQASNSAYPVDATVQSAGTVINGRVHNDVSAGITLSLGQRVYITLVPYTQTAAGGAVGQSIHLTATRHDATATKTVRFGANSLTEFFNGSTRNPFEIATGYARPQTGSATAAMEGVNNLQIPDGVTIIEFGADLYSTGSPPTGSSAGMTLYRGTSTGGQTSIASVTTAVPGVGWAALTASLSESTTGRRYQVKLDGAYGVSVTNNDSRCAGYYVQYTMPSTANTL